MLDPMFDSADAALRWPRAVFARELAALRTESDPTARVARIGWLLEDAFVGSTVARAYETADDRPPFGRIPEPAGAPGPPSFLDRLADNIDDLRVVYEPRPYWPQRDAPSRLQLDPGAVRSRFARTVSHLEQLGFFDRETGRACVDETPPATDRDEVLADRLHVAGLWPLQPEVWDLDTFLGLVEVFHDLAARSRYRRFHDYGGCGWHYGEFATDTGRALYRWRVNQMLEAGELGLRLAESGPDVGRLVRVTDDARTELVERTLATPDTSVAGRVEHAIVLFRRRGATVEDRRSAVITLAGVLEERRALIKAEIGEPDEGALFTLANKFAIRHQRRGQQGDYDPAFLDWMFWWYLATVEVTDRIIDRQATTTNTGSANTGSAGGTAP